MIHINLTFDSINVSAQVGDTVYYTYGGQMLGGFDAQTDLSNTKRLGEIIAINGNTITVEVDDSILNIMPTVGSYISFVKDKKANTTSLLGYYMSANFVNDSRKTNVELFSVGTQVVESSK